jgi:hypothetical protein
MIQTTCTPANQGVERMGARVPLPPIWGGVGGVPPTAHTCRWATEHA